MNYRIALLGLALFLLPMRVFGFAPDSIPPTWTQQTRIGLNVNQASFSENWKGGGTNSLAFAALFNNKTNYKQHNLTFDAETDLQFGQQNTRGQGVRKTLDRIFIDVKLGYKLSPFWNAYVGSNFQTQFTDGFRYEKTASGIEREILISRFFSPAYLTSSIGFEWKKSDKLWLRLGTGALRQTIVTDTTLYRTEPKNYGVPIGSTILNEFAFQLMGYHNRKLMENVDGSIRYIGFWPYDRPISEVTHRAELAITMKINKYLNVSLLGLFIFDPNQDKDVQLSQTTGIGLLIRL